MTHRRCQNGWWQSQGELVSQCRSSCLTNLQRTRQSPLLHASCDYGGCNTWPDVQESYKRKWVMGAGDKSGDGSGDGTCDRNIWWVGDERGKSQVMESGEWGHSVWTSQYGMCAAGYLMIITALQYRTIVPRHSWQQCFAMGRWQHWLVCLVAINFIKWSIFINTSQHIKFPFIFILLFIYQVLIGMRECAQSHVVPIPDVTLYIRACPQN